MMISPIDKNKTLEQLENNYWDEPTYDSHLVQTCHRLRKKPLKNFEIEDFRILIGQNFSLNYLIPLAIVELQKNILADGAYYEGDLLLRVLKIDSKYWLNNTGDWATLRDLIASKVETIENSDNVDQIKKDIFNSFEKFKMINI